MYDTKSWAAIYAPFYELPMDTSKRIQWLPVGTVVTVDLTLSAGDFWAVEFGGRRGWIRHQYLEPYVEGLPVNPFVIANQTPEKTDFEQYALLKGVKQVNYCGPLCIAYSLKKDLSDVLAAWEIKAPSFWKGLFDSAGKMRGTGYGELQAIYKLLGVPSMPLTTATLEPILKRSLYTPWRLYQLVRDGWVIAGVRMNAITGRLKGEGVGHWVLVTDVIQERTGYGWVDVYNPAPHRIERYSWEQWIATTLNTPSGVYVSKTDIQG